MKNSSFHQPPLVSIITPTFNRVRLIPDAIKSVLGQTFGNWEHIIVDDGSMDNTEDVVRKFDDPRIIYINRFKQRGVSATRNLGLRLASGKYIAFLDSDDFWPKHSLVKRINYLNHHPRVALVYGRMKFLRMNPIQPASKKSAKNIQAVHTYKYYHQQLKLCHSHRERYQLLVKADYSFIPTGTVMVRKNIIDQIGGFDENFAAVEDYDLWLRITRKNDFHFIDDALMTYRVASENSLIAQVNKNHTYNKFLRMAKKKAGQF